MFAPLPRRAPAPCALAVAMLLAAMPAFAAPIAFQFVSPPPGARYVAPHTDVVLRPGFALDPRSIGSSAIVATGAASGPHAGTTVLADDGMTLVFTPDRPFARRERVTVAFDGSVTTRTGESLPPLSYTFTISAIDPEAQRDRIPRESLGLPEPAAGALSTMPSPGEPPPGSPQATLPAGSTAYKVPPTYPLVALTLAKDPEPGAVFLSPFSGDPSDSGHVVIVDNAGRPLFYRRVSSPAIDLKRQANGLLTYYSGSPADGGPPRFYALDSTYAVVDSFAMGNGYITDSHDIQLLPDGHVLLLAYDPQLVDMSAVVPGGLPDAIVIGAVVQELDRSKRVVFQWRSWDHFAITDCVSPLVNLKGKSVDYVHMNSLEALDGDALLVSSRHMSELTKIDRHTGAIVWRMGPHAKHNDFTFVNDTRGFSHQHDARLLPNGHLTVFDNGNGLSPQYSRAVEYVLDEHAAQGRPDPPASDSARVHSARGLRAKLVWQYRDTPDAYGSFMGSVQRLDDGGTLIGWGGTVTGPRLTEVGADGAKALEMTMQFGTWSYRAFRCAWRTTRIAAPESLAFGEVDAEDFEDQSLAVSNGSSTPVTIDDAFVTDPAFTLLTRLPVTLAPGETRDFTVRFRPSSSAPYRATLYLKSLSRNELVAQTTALTGNDDAQGMFAFAPAMPSAGFRLEPPTPNPARGVVRLGFDVPRETRVKLDVYDVRGRRIARLVNDVLPAGHHERSWEPRRVAPGAYYCRLKSGRNVTFGKLVIAG